MWASLREIAKCENCKIHDICSLIHLRKNPATSLTAAIRVFLMLYFRASSTEEGHKKAGHGNFQQMISRARMDEGALDVMRAHKSNSRPAHHSAVSVSESRMAINHGAGVTG